MFKKPKQCTCMDDLNDFIEETYASTFSFAYRRSGNQALANDLTQECYMRIIKRMRIQEQTITQSYLYTIIIHLHNDVYRSQQNLQSSDLTYYPDQTLTPHEQSMANTKRDQIIQAIAALPLVQRDTLLLYYYEDCSYKEIAMITKTNRETVKSRLKSAKQKLRIKLKEGDLL